MIRLRRATIDEAAPLSCLARRSKAHWGYDADFLAEVHDALAISAAQITEDDCVVADDNGTVLGFYRLGGPPPDGLLMDFFIDPPAIGTGLGRTLWDHAITTARTRAHRTLTLESDPHAEGFYLRMGAVRVGERESDSYPGRFLPLMTYTLT
ncbi:MAG: GNAT family N-acetyltransferase [Umezawaea sp.]